MKTKFHQSIVDIAFQSMPVEYRNKFLTGFSHELLLEYSDVPYVSDRFREPEHLHIDHTYKLQLKGNNLHRIGESNALGEVVNFSDSIKELALVKNYNLVKYNIAKATHYIIDIATFAHVNHSTCPKSVPLTLP